LIEFLSKVLDFILCEESFESVGAFFMCDVCCDELGEEYNIELLVKSIGKTAELIFHALTSVAGGE